MLKVNEGVRSFKLKGVKLGEEIKIPKGVEYDSKVTRTKDGSFTVKMNINTRKKERDVVYRIVRKGKDGGHLQRIK